MDTNNRSSFVSNKQPNTRSISTTDLIAFKDILEKDDIRRSLTIQKNRESRAASSIPAKPRPSIGKKISTGEQRSLYERIIGTTNSTKISSNNPIRNAFVSLFSKESSEVS
jgi:hypothetical protein